MTVVASHASKVEQSQPSRSEQAKKMPSAENLLATMSEYWGYDEFKPLQLDAMTKVVEGRDSLVVFPTGAGKSLCFQVPALCLDGLAVVVSPLISLMKDQVDALQKCGVPAACLNSHSLDQQRRKVVDDIRQQRLKLLYVAPERLLTDTMMGLLRSTTVSMFAIDESHCVSEWGHDFRPEYRGLSVLKDRFQATPIHAYTATATEKVRGDVARQLRLNDPAILIAPMDRPNLHYHVLPRRRGLDQMVQVINDNRSESGIIYCISRKNVDETSAALNAMGYKALPYHAGMSAEDRRRHQEAFLREEVNIIVATVAFGMGIDKSNVRYVIHAAMPKSIEAYQQESGRAGRDGLDAGCWLFHAYNDYTTWSRLIRQSDSESGREGALQSLEFIQAFCAGSECRHRALLKHFGQSALIDNCNACDICLGDVKSVDEPLIVAQKILSCVLRVEQRFGADYVAQILVGSRDARVLQNEHDRLTTYGLLPENKQTVRGWIEQLVQQQFLQRTGEYNVLQVTDLGRAVLKGEQVPQLRQQCHGGSTVVAEDSWEGIDRALFARLRQLRTTIAAKDGVAAYNVFSDGSLRDMARRRPSSLERFHMVHGVGQQKLTDYGQTFLNEIIGYCQSQDVDMDVQSVSRTTINSTAQKPLSTGATASFPHFDEGRSVDDVAKAMQRATSTVSGYLEQYIQHRRIGDPTRWVPARIVKDVETAIGTHGTAALKPLFVALNEKVPYDQIRIVVACVAQRNLPDLES